MNLLCSLVVTVKLFFIDILVSVFFLPNGGSAGKKNIHLPELVKIVHSFRESDRTFYPNCESKIKGKMKRERAKTPKFRACGALKGHNNSF